MGRVEHSRGDAERMKPLRPPPPPPPKKGATSSPALIAPEPESGTVGKLLAWLFLLS